MFPCAHKKRKRTTTDILSIHAYSSGKEIFLMRNEMNSMVYILYALIFPAL